jgi:hypothetical protein
MPANSDTDRMKWAFLILSLVALSAHAEGEEVSCPGWFTRLRRGTKDFVVGTAKRSRDSVVELKNNVKAEGPQRIFVRKRTPEEKAMGYKDYFIAAPDDWMPKYWFTKALKQIGKLNPLRNYTPTRGIILSADRAFLRSYTATNGFRGTAVLGTGLAASIALQEVFYEKPMEYLEETIPLSNAANASLDSEYSFAYLRKELAAGKKTREEALEEVKKEFKARKTYYDYMRYLLTKTGAKSLEEIAPYVPLGEANFGRTMNDLRYFYSKDILSNKAYGWESGSPGVSPEKYPALFALNHLKRYSSDSLSKWLAPGFRPDSLSSDIAARGVYDQVMNDPFRQKLIAYQKSHPDQVSPDALEAWIAEDIEWMARIAELDVIGAGIKGPGGKFLTLNDRRDYFLKQKNLSL